MHLQSQWVLGCLLTATATKAAVVCRAQALSLATVKEAVDAMMGFYDPETGLWDPSAPWWQSALALQAVLDYMAATGSREYLAQAQRTIEVQRRVLPWWPAGGGEFRADSTDDTGWWALAMTSMYGLTGDEADFLQIAKKNEAYMWGYWTGVDSSSGSDSSGNGGSGGSGSGSDSSSSSSCGGGIIWHVPTLSYHNAISNELYLLLAATLHNLTGDPVYLARALQEWAWFRDSGMINAENLINDGLLEVEVEVGGATPPSASVATASCANNGAPTWTYNQGVILSGLVGLYRATGDGEYLSAARRVADAVVASLALMPPAAAAATGSGPGSGAGAGAGGILTEPCAAMPEEGCEPDRTAFKGIFMRHLAKLDAVLADRPYGAVIQWNAQTMYDAARNATDRRERCTLNARLFPLELGGSPPCRWRADTT